MFDGECPSFTLSILLTHNLTDHFSTHICEIFRIKPLSKWVKTEVNFPQIYNYCTDDCQPAWEWAENRLFHATNDRRRCKLTHVERILAYDVYDDRWNQMQSIMIVKVGLCGPGPDDDDGVEYCRAEFSKLGRVRTFRMNTNERHFFWGWREKKCEKSCVVFVWEMCERKFVQLHFVKSLQNFSLKLSFKKSIKK